VAGSKGTAVIFTCNTCPYSKAYEARLMDLARDYQAQGIGFVAINANDPAVQPGDSFAEMVKLAKAKSYPFPYLVDTTQEVARAYGAKVTPHVFLLDASGKLVYRGRVDSSVRPEDVKERELAGALAAVATGKEVPVPVSQAFGCSIKWSSAD
jgi:thiol-disulfide isomerase/thioredoxin